MRVFVLLLFVIFSICAMAADPPVSLKGRLGTKLAPKWNLQVPGNQATNLGGIDALIETGSADLLSDAGFEAPLSLSGWTAVGGTHSVDTSDYVDDGGKQSRAVSLSLYDGTIVSQCKTAVSGGNFENSMWVKTSLGIIQVCSSVDSIEQQCVDVPSTDTWSRVVSTSVAVPGKSVCTYAKTTTTTGIGVSVKFDTAYMGLNRNIGTVQQANYVGSVVFGPNCSWSRTSSSSFANYSDDGTCTTTVDGAVSIAGATRPAITVPNAAPGFYKLTYSGSLRRGASGTACAFRIYDGTDSLGNVIVYDSQDNIGHGTLVGGKSYTSSSSSLTFDIQGTGDGSSLACDIIQDTNYPGKIIVEYFPSQAQQVVNAGQTNYGWTAYTPTFTGFGTVTNINCQHKRDGQDLLVDCKFTSGTGTATEARVSLPGGLIPNVASIRHAGTYINAGTGAYGVYTLVEPSNSYFTFGLQDSSSSAYTKRAGNNLGVNGVDQNFLARVPIVGWIENGKAPQLVNSVVSKNQGVDVIVRASTNGICSSSPCALSVNKGITQIVRGGTGDYDVQIPGGTYSERPQCFATIFNPNGVVDAGIRGNINPPTTTSYKFFSMNVTSETALDTGFDVFCIGSR